MIEAPREPRAERGRGRNQLKIAQLTLAAGTPLVAMTAEPLLVRVPRGTR
jgi:hypothetical protein